MPIKSKRATTMRTDKRPLIKVPIFRKLENNEILDRGDFWSKDNANHLMTTLVRVSSEDLGHKVKDRLEIARGGAFWRLDKEEKQEPSPIPPKKT